MTPLEAIQKETENTGFISQGYEAAKAKNPSLFRESCDNSWHYQVDASRSPWEVCPECGKKRKD